MDNFDYLNSISVPTRPAPVGQSNGGLSAFLQKFSPETKKYLLIGFGVFIGLLIFLSVLGNIFGAQARKEQDAIERVDLKAHFLNQSLTEYLPYLKSSALRTYSSSTSATLTNTVRDLTPLISTYYDYDEGISPEYLTPALLSEESLAASDFSSTLETARLNGILDRTFQRELTLQLTLLLTSLSDAAARTDKEDIQDVFETAYASLSTIRAQVESYSDPSL